MQALLRILVAAWLCAFGPAQATGDGGFVVIAHAGVARVDAPTLQRLYTGRAIEVAGIPVTVVNLPAGDPLRARFLQQVAGLDDDRYVAYWTVRRHVGKGAPPRELDSAAAVLDFVAGTPGALGYVAVTDLRPGSNVICRV